MLQKEIFFIDKIGGKIILKNGLKILEILQTILIKKINIIVGISPGLDISFKKHDIDYEINFLIKNLKFLLKMVLLKLHFYLMMYLKTKVYLKTRSRQMDIIMLSLQTNYPLN